MLKILKIHLFVPTFVLLLSGMLVSAFAQSNTNFGSPGTSYTIEEKKTDLQKKADVSEHANKPHMNKSMKPMKIVNRKGLAVIADFADTKLEDWQGSGIKDISDLSDQLHKMEAHWAWLSRGQERFKWDIIRVTLPVNLKADAYPGWGDYRNAVADLVKQQIDVTKYDKNHDGIVDTVWVITSTSGKYYDYMVGGTAFNNGVNIFVDGQDSLSVISGATGNFNHEVGHTIGLQDMYGPYGTLSYLTLMADSWPVPPQDFAAYERSVLGWVRPKEIRRTTKKIHLSSANKNRKVVRVSTLRDNEYFLIEYRHRPDSGFGSIALPYNGLAVYHVLESSSQSINPPLVKLEAADGYIAPDSSPELTDFLYPENFNMQRPFVVHSYYGGRKIFEIDNLYWVGDEDLVFDIALSPLDITQNNLLANPSFEQGGNLTPAFWQRDAFELSAALVWDVTVAKDGKHSASISASSPNDARWIQTVSNLSPGKSHEFCGWIRGSNIITGPLAGVGANVSVMGGFTSSGRLSGSFDWTKACVTFMPENTSTTLACRLGFYGSTVTGKIWCDAMSLEVLESAF
ncbi:MAG: hypothetical protein QX198_17835 [Methylococcaceae bacterium]